MARPAACRRPLEYRFRPAVPIVQFAAVSIRKYECVPVRPTRILVSIEVACRDNGITSGWAGACFFRARLRVSFRRPAVIVHMPASRSNSFQVAEQTSSSRAAVHNIRRAARSWGLALSSGSTFARVWRSSTACPPSWILARRASPGRRNPFASNRAWRPTAPLA